LGVFQPAKEKRVGKALECNGHIIGVQLPKDLFPDSGLEQRGQFAQNLFVERLDVSVEPGHEVITRTLGLGEIEPYALHIFSEDRPLGPYVVPEDRQGIPLAVEGLLQCFVAVKTMTCTA